MLLERVISGGQTGVDQAGLRVARRLGYETGGWMPKGFRTNTGPNPELAKEFHLMETSSPGYPVRTQRNVDISNGTIILGHQDSAGCKLTARFALESGKHLLKIRHHYDSLKAVHLIRTFLTTKPIVVLNIAGNREESYPGIGNWAYKILLEALDKDKIVN